MKSRKSKLDPFAEFLDDQELAGSTLAQMSAALAERGCVVSLSRLSDFLERRRSGKRQDQLFALVASGGRMNAELDQAFQKNPAPAVSQLINVVKTLIASLQLQGQANPEMLELSNAMLKSVLDFSKLEAKKEDQALSREKFELLQKQADRASATEQALDSQLSPEQRAQRIAEIYGRT